MGSFSIPLAAQVYTPDNIVDDFAKAAAYKNALAQRPLYGQEQQKNQLAIEAARRQAADEAATRAAMQRMYGAPSTTAAVASGAATMGGFYAGGAPGTPSLNALTGAHIAALPGVPSGPSSSIAPPPAPAGVYVGGAPAAPASAAAAAPAAPAAGAPPRPRVPSMEELIQHGVPATVAPTLLEKMQTVAKTAADIDQSYAAADASRASGAHSDAETRDLFLQQESQMADAILHGRNADGTINPSVAAWHLQTFASHGPEFDAIARKVGSQLAGMDPAGQESFLTSLTRAPKQLEANAKESEAATAAGRLADEKGRKDQADLAARLGASTNQADWMSTLSKASPAAIAALNPPAAWSAGAAQTMLAKGQTANEQITAAETAKRDANTAANEARARNQEQQNINLRLKAFNQQYGNPLEGATPSELTTSKSRAAGDLPMPTSRTKGYDRSFALAVAQDPTFAQYAGTRYDTKKNFKEKGDSDNVVQLATALEHLDRAKSNSAAMGFEPTLGTNLFPTQHRYHQDVYNLVDEVGKLIKSGVVPEAEGKRGIDNLMSALQSNRDAGLDELSNLMGGKVAAKIQKYITGTGQLVPASMFDEATQKRLKAAGFANGIDWNATAAPTAATAPAAAAPAAAAPDLSKVSTADLLKALGK